MKTAIPVALGIILVLVISGCTVQEQYVIPLSECPITIYTITNSTDEFESISVYGTLESDTLESWGVTYHIDQNGIYYQIGAGWEEPGIREEDTAKIKQLVGKKIKLNGKGIIRPDDGWAWLAIESCN